MKVKLLPADDPIVEYILRDIIDRHLSYAVTWWDHVDEFTGRHRGVHVPPGAGGMKVRVVPNRYQSPIPGVQVFPYVDFDVLKFPRCAGGKKAALEAVMGNGIVFGGMTVLPVHNASGAGLNVYSLAFVPEDVLKGADGGTWVYLSPKRRYDLMLGIVDDKFRTFLMKKELDLRRIY